MRDLLLLGIHLLGTFACLLCPGGVRTVAAAAQTLDAAKSARELGKLLRD